MTMNHRVVWAGLFAGGCVYIQTPGSSPITFPDTGDSTETTDTATTAGTGETGGTTDPGPCVWAVASANELGALPPAPGTSSGNGGFSVSMEGMEAWIWSDLTLDTADPGGALVRSGTWTTATGLPAVWGGGAPGELLPHDGSCTPAVSLGGAWS